MSLAARPTPAQASGGDAEDGAAAFLAANGLAIVARNYRTRLGEIDLIARDGACLVFVEVRLRHGHEAYGGPLASITPRKRRRIVAAARQYLMRLARTPPCRFDVIAMGGDAPHWVKGAFDTTEG